MHKTEYFLLLLLDAVFKRLPFAFGKLLADLLYFIVAYFLRYREAVILKNLQRAYPASTETERKKMLKKVYRHFVYLWMEFLQGSRINEAGWEKRFDWNDLEVLDGAVKENKGVVLITGHLGNFEWISQVMSLKGYRFAAVAKAQSNPYVDTFICKRREKPGTRIFYMKEAFKEGLKFLTEGGILGLVADQDAHKKGIFVDFFGLPASTFAGPALFHMRTGAPIVFIALIRKKYAKFDLHFEKVSTAQFDHNDKEKAIIDITQAHARVLEKWVRRYPEQWFWMHRRWKTQPAAVKEQ